MHPQERHGRDVGRDVRRDGDQQPRGHRREHDPARRVAPGRRGGRRVRAVDAAVTGGWSGVAPQERSARAIKTMSSTEPIDHAAALVGERHQRLDRDRIGDQRQEAADIARGIEKIRVLRGRMIGAREPGLQQRPVGREREERQPDRDREQAEQPERLADFRRPSPAGCDRQRQRRRRRPTITTRCTRIEARPGA